MESDHIFIFEFLHVGIDVEGIEIGFREVLRILGKLCGNFEDIEFQDILSNFDQCLIFALVNAIRKIEPKLLDVYIRIAGSLIGFSLEARASFLTGSTAA